MTESAQPASPVEALVHDLYGRSRAADYDLGEAEFAQVLAEIASECLPVHHSEPECAHLYESLHLEELALARACAAGIESAWDVFLTRYRAKLYEMAASIARDDSIARELADSLYAELYGLRIHEERRVCKLANYRGRGSLQGWLRTVLVQEFVNRYRVQKRLVSLEEREEQRGPIAAAPAEPVRVADAKLERATDDALAALPAEDRFVLAAYFLDGRTLADVARMLKVHESTVSRKIDRLTGHLRKEIVTRLMDQGLDKRAAQEAMEVDVRDMDVDVRLRLAQGTDSATFNRRGE